MASESVFLGDVVTLTLTATDPDTGAAKNLSVYDSVSIVLAVPRSSTVVTLAATLPGGGTDGVAQATTAAGQLNAVGNWSAQIVGYKSSVAYAHSTEFAFMVDQPIA